MSHTGIRLKIELPAGPILLADSDWLHLNAIFTAGLPEPTMEDIIAGRSPEHPWHTILVQSETGLSISVQAVMLSDSYPDDAQPDEWTGDLPE